MLMSMQRRAHGKLRQTAAGRSRMNFEGALHMNLVMRRILVDAARARASTKRGGGMQRIDHSTAVNFDKLAAPGTDRATELCALDDALGALAQQDPRRAQVIELRYFAGLRVEETGEALGVSPQTVMRDWKLARAWLGVELRR